MASTIMELDNSSTSSGAQHGGNPSHSRTYQACIPCRRRKVRCDLGPVDNPHDPPCVRCRRESKDCYFSATRRKRTKGDGGELDDEELIDDYEMRNGRKRLRAASPTGSLTPTSARRPDSLSLQRSDTGPSYTTHGFSAPPLTPGGSLGRYQPLRRPTSNHGPDEEEDQKRDNATAAILQTGEVYSGHDALNLLFEAAGHNGDIEHHRTGSSSSMPRSVTNTVNTPSSFASPQGPGTRGFTKIHVRSAPETMVDPALSQAYTNGNSQNQQYQVQSIREMDEALKAWSRFRFVRAGWFTAQEGMAYIDYFYKYLSPLTPIVLPDFRRQPSHAQLLQEEPMLAITILTVASRYMKLSGPGANTRPVTVHDKLWNYLRGMIDRVIWGQEQFGGGFCGAGQQAGSDVNPLERKGLRTLGTVESMMLLTEWHPRAMHFPPGDDDDEILIPEDPTEIYSQATASLQSNVPRDGATGQRIDSWLEPCWRSDRMCWMLLGNAMSLAYEIGVFDEMSETTFYQELQGQPPEKVYAYFIRKNHLKELLQIYATQTSGRLGLTSMLPKSYLEDTKGKTPESRLQERQRKLRASEIRRSNPSIASPGCSNSQINVMSSQEWVLYYWMEIAAIMEAGNRKLFPNRRYTRDLISSGRYMESLNYFQPLLRGWWEGFNQCQSIPKHMRDIMTIEYEYCRVYLNCLSLQAVVERCTHNTPAKNYAQPVQSKTADQRGTSYKDDGGAIPAQTLRKWMEYDRRFIDELIDACRNVLKIVAEGLYPDDYLKHAPVRTYFRIISVTIILLKTFALGATEDDVAISLGHLDKAIDALRICIVDDVHIGNSFSELATRLTSRIRSRFVRLSANGGNATSRGTTRSPPNGLHGAPTSSMPPPVNMPHNLAQNNQWSTFNQQQISPHSPAPANTGGRATPTHPSLWGISTETYDPDNSNISIMLPPSFGANGTYDNSSFGNGMTYGNSVGDDGSNSNYMGSDWLALPLDPLLNSYGADVNQTTYGPDVGGLDMLDLLLSGGSGFN